MIKFELKKGETYFFNLKSNKGHILLESIGFENKLDLDLIVSQLNSLVNDTGQFERKTNHNGEFMFNLKDENGKIVGYSQCYNSEAGMENGIKNLKNKIDFSDYK